jgi:serine protease inhibitor
MRQSGSRRGYPRALSGLVAAGVIGLLAMTSHGMAAEDQAAPKSPESTVTAAPAAEPAAPTGVVQEAAAPKSTSQAATKAAGPRIDPASLLAAQLRLGGNLIGKLAGNKAQTSNVVVSPASLALVFSLLDMGADDQMRSALRHTLGFGGAKETTKRDLEEVRSITTSVLRRANEGGPLALANMIVFDPQSKPYPQALQGLKAAGADVSVEALDKPETLAHINDWVKDRTRGLIPSILDDAPEQAGLVAVNALYFKDRWKAPFDPAATRDGKFQVAGGKPIEVPMMHSDGHFAFRQNNDFVAVELPYASGDYRLVIVTSKDAPRAVNDFSAVVGWLGGQGFEALDGELAMPRFSASGSEDLLPTLDALGLGAARKERGALKGFTETSQTISRVVQKTELRVNEEGTEAAAATAVTTMRSVASSPTQYVKMVVDKPFVFALRDRQAGLVLLQGYVASPAAMAEASPK